MPGPLDVLVVGGGPAGCAAAIELARSGRDVLLVDKASFPRDKCCGDGLTSLALRHLEDLGLEVGSVLGWSWIERLIIRSPSGATSTARLPTGGGHFAAVAPRRALDAALVDVARRAGARVLESTTVASMDGVFGDRVVAVLSSDERVAARHVVAADGAWSPTRRLIGEPATRHRGDWHAFRQYARWEGSTEELTVAFEPDLLPTYFWSFPRGDGAANVGFGVHVTALPRIGEMAARWRELAVRPHLAPFLAGGAADRLRSWPIPAHVDRTRLAFGRVLYAGDAAAACDVLTGEGIGQALETGRLAARSIATSDPRDPLDAARAHTRRVRDRLLADHRLARAMTRLLGHQAVATAGVAAFRTSPGVGATLARWMFEDFPRHRIAHPRSWPNRGVGAYRER